MSESSRASGQRKFLAELWLPLGGRPLPKSVQQMVKAADVWSGLSLLCLEQLYSAVFVHGQVLIFLKICVANTSN